MLPVLPMRRIRVARDLQMWAWLALLPFAVVLGLGGGALLASFVTQATDTASAEFETALPAIPQEQPARTQAVFVSPRPTPTATPPPLGPRTGSVVSLHTGPTKQYPVIGTLAGGATLTVVGRDQEALWVAVEFPPGSSLIAWLPVAHIVGLSDVESLEIHEVVAFP